MTCLDSRTIKNVCLVLVSRCQNTLIKRIPLFKGDFEPTANFSETCQMTFLRHIWIRRGRKHTCQCATCFNWVRGTKDMSLSVTTYEKRT